MEDAVSHGVTTVQDFSDWDDFLVFEQMESEGKLPVRIAEWLPFADAAECSSSSRRRIIRRRIACCTRPC